MKNFKLLFFTFIITFNPVFAFDYTEEDKKMFYDAFIDGYVTEMTKTVNQLDIEQEKKDKFTFELKKNIDKKDLIKSSWNCIQSYPIEQIVSASVICTNDWTNKQAQKNKKLFEILK
ncbi:MAG: hypothetical protein LUH05_00790 [Candidatus Gastranaerophilales bacterium]|nr:hypothetical protein [Candidatus Gastranaerophilales bacterium]